MRWWPFRRRPLVRDAFALGMLSVAPGDTLVLKTPDVLTMAAVGSVRASFRNEFPDHKVLVLTGGWELSILRQAEAAVMRGPDGPVIQAQVDEWRAAWEAQHECTVYATGGIVKPGVYLVGESGPEQVGRHPGEIGLGWA